MHNYSKPPASLETCFMSAAKLSATLPRGKMTRKSSEDLATNFFNDWFVKNGHRYFFLFKKNVHVTDMQFAELSALIREALAKRPGAPQLNFATSAAFRLTIARLIRCLSEDGTKDMKALAQFVVTNYGEMINNTVIMEQYFGSCVIYVPHQMALPLESMTFVSGYIHSCGRLVYMENVYHANETDFIKQLRSYLRSVRHAKPVIFRPLSHEDFTSNDRALKDELSDGLDEVKLYVHKQVIEGHTLSSFIERLRHKFRGRLLIPEAGNSTFDKYLPGERERDHSLWLVRDHSLVHEGKRPGDNHFLICYEQQYINSSIFQILDENKPAWMYHTTIPHSLMAAMINITQPYWPKRGAVDVLDAFAGSGTTWLETLKHPRIRFEGADIEPIAPLLAEDNLAVFCADQAELHRWITAIKSISPALMQKLVGPEHKLWLGSKDREIYLKAKTLLGEFMAGNEDIDALDITTQAVSTLRKQDVLVRVIFYTLLKSRRRYHAALAAKAIDPDRALVKELSGLSEQLTRLQELREMMVGGRCREARVTFTGLYSKAVSMSPQYLDRLAAKEAWKHTVVRRVEDLESERQFDVIISDPPYGFNTVEAMSDLATMYNTALRLLLRSLRRNGQLVLALPDWSHSGRHIPAFVLKEFVTHQVLSLGRECGLDAYQPAHQVPEAKWLSGPPYYWESARALRRSILHFRFRSR